MNPHRILIVDDEPNIRSIMEHILKTEGYQLDTTGDGRRAIEMINQNVYDLMLLDLQMKPIGGIQVLKEARRKAPELVVIILTAHSSIESAVEALRLGAFDYLFKPAIPDTVRERVREGLNRRKQATDRQKLIKQVKSLRRMLQNLDTESNHLDQTHGPARFITSGKLVIDLHHRVSSFDGKLLDLTTTEFNLLVNLVKNAPNPVTPKKLVNEALEYEAGHNEAGEIIKYHIHHLRQKIEVNPLEPCLIKTIRYKGYFWCGE